MVVDDDGARWHFHNGISTTRQASGKSGGHKPLSDVGVYEPCGQTLGLHKEIYDVATGEKIGLFNPDTWGAYVLNDEVFVKRTQANPSEAYPDFGCSYEEFTNNELEIETLGPMTKVPPGKTAEQVEHWSLHRNVHGPRCWRKLGRPSRSHPGQLMG